MNEYMLLEEEIALLPEDNREITEKAKEETEKEIEKTEDVEETGEKTEGLEAVAEEIEEGIGEAFIEIPDKDRQLDNKDEDSHLVWPWAVGGVVILLALIAAVITIWKKKREHPAENAACYEPLSSDCVNTTKGSFGAAVCVGELHQIGERESQQDCFAVSPLERLNSQGVLAVVADGMGGLKDGDKVSQMVVSSMLNDFLSVDGHPQGALLEMVGQANQKVNQMLGYHVGQSGSTVVAGLVRDGYFYYVSVGDSRICLFRGEQLIQLNREHIYRNDLAVRAINNADGVQTALSDPKGGGLTSYIGMGQLKYVDIPAQPIRIQPNDKFILMSDGVFNALTEGEMIGALRAPAEQAADQIGRMIAGKAFRNQDNYTAVVLGF